MKAPSHLVFPVLALSATIAFSPAVAYATTLDLNFGALDFSNPNQPNPGDEQDLGEDLDSTDNPNYVDYQNVVTIGGTEVDARVTLVSTQNLVNTGGNGVDYLDEDPRDSPEDVGLDDSGISTQIDLNDNSQEGYAEIKIAFFDDVTAGTPTSITLQNIALNIKDVDLNQFVELTPSSYSLSTNPMTVLTVTDQGSGLLRFSGDGQSSDDTDEQNWVFARYESASSITIKVGATSGSGSQSFDIVFSAISFTAAPSEESSSEPPEPAAFPLIHMDVLGATGSPVTSSELLFEGEGLIRGTPYSLSVGNAFSLITGVVGRYGYFSEKLPLQSFGPGEYLFTLRTTAPDGSALVLTKTLRVGSSGEIISFSPTTSAAALAATGPSGSGLLLGSSALVLGLIGVVLLIAARKQHA